MKESVFINSNKRWHKKVCKDYNCYYTGFGYLKNISKELSFDSLSIELHKKNSLKEIKKILSNIDGHFSLVFISHKKIIACVDWIRAYPLFYYTNNQQEITISNNPKAIRKKHDCNEINKYAAIDIFASGYATGDRTLFSKIKQVTPGCLLIKNNKATKIVSYKNYRPEKGYQLNNNKYSVLKRKFVESLDEVFTKLLNKNKNRNIFIPLSAGYDSRLILSCLLRHGHKNITCYSYGLKNNSEMTVAKEICSKLAVNFVQINTSPKIIRAFSKRKFYADYMEYSDTYASVPFIQDLPALYLYEKKQMFPKDALFINGNTGDFISGGHIPSELINHKQINFTLIVNLFIKKHFNLWDSCLSSPYKDVIFKRVSELLRIIERQKVNMPLPAIFEALEWSERQAKFVITGQRVYEFIDRDWRLPLWEDPIKNFFENLDYSNKLNQYFYKKVLIDLNWQGIWKDFPINKKKIFPLWMRPIRIMLKVFFLSLGREKWHKYERSYINYWTSYISSEALVPYFDAYKFKNNHRNAVSLRALHYLRKHNAFDIK